MIQTVTIHAQRPWKHSDIALFHDEPLRLVIEDRPVEEEIIFTVAPDSAAVPVVQIEGTDVFDLSAETLAVIPEGATYRYNVWTRREGALKLLQRGGILSRRSIAPLAGDVTVDPLMITGGPVPQAVVGEVFTYQPSVTGGVEPYSFDLVAGVLPAGLQLMTTTGAITGVPSSASLFDGIVLRVTDNDGRTAEMTAFGITVVPAEVTTQPLLVSEDAPLLLVDGDSIMAYNATRLITEHYVGGFFRKPEAYNQARAGDSTQQILDGVQNVIDQIVPGKTVVLVGPTGANQSPGSSTFAEISSQQQQIFDMYLAAGAIVVAIPTLPEADQFGSPAENDALLAWVYAHETGGTVSYGGDDFFVTARANFYALDIGTPDRGQTGAAAYGANDFNPYTMKNDQTHPNGIGARYLADKVAVLLEGLVTSDIFAEVGLNMLGASSDFAGTVAASKPGITGTVPTAWDVSRSGSSTTWDCSKNGSDQLVAGVAGAGNNSVLSLTIDVPINGAAGDIFDMVVEVDVVGAANGFKGLRIITEEGTDTQGDADFYPDQTSLTLRSNSHPLVSAESTKTFVIQALVEPGANVTLTFKRAAVFYVETIAGALAINGTPSTLGEVGTPYGFAPVATGGDAPYSFDLASGTLPAGLSISSTSGAITGTPTNEETASGIAIRVTDMLGDTATLPAFSLQIVAAAAPQNATLPQLSTATPSEGETVTVTQGVWTNAPTVFEYRWRHSGNLQAGADTASHVPQVGSAPQTLSAEVRAQNAGGWSAWANTGETAPISAASTGSVVPWDPTILNATDLAFSDSDRTLNNTSANGNRHARGTQPISGKIYFEVVATTEVRGIGVADETVSATQTKTLGVNCAYWAGVAILNGSTNNVGGSYDDGDTAQVAVDRTANLIWVRKNGTGDWNGSNAADPATGTGGITISGLTSATIFAFVSMKPGGEATLNGSPDRLAFAIPAGFTTLP